VFVGGVVMRLVDDASGSVMDSGGGSSVLDDVSTGSETESVADAACVSHPTVTKVVG